MVVVLFRALNLPPLLGYLLVAWQFGLSWQGALALEALGATGSTIRRRGLRGFEANPETRLEAGDVLVIYVFRRPLPLRKSAC